MSELLIEKTPRWFAYIHGAFLDRKEYDRVLAIARTAIPAVQEDVGLKRVDYCFLPITVCTSSEKSQAKGWKRVGDTCKFVVNSVTYNKTSGYLVLHVRMKKNFTCCVSPHIVVMTRLQQDYTSMASWQYYVPQVNDISVTITPTYVNATLAALCDKTPPQQKQRTEKKEPVPATAPTLPKKPQQQQQQQPQQEDEDEVVGTLNGKPVFIGKFGGKYILRPSGRKRYVKQSEVLDDM